MQKYQYRPELDGIRAIAVLAVIVFHLGSEFLSNGYLGVDIFFILSGYVVTHSVIGIKKSPLEFMGYFYSRRIKRLLPGLFLSILLGTIFCSLLVPPGEFKSIFLTAQFALFGFSNYILMQQSTDYFGIGNELNLFGHTWSLGIEEQFYFFFPFIYILFIQKSNLFNKKVFFSYLVFLFISLIVFIYSFINYPEKAYYFTPIRLWQLSLGVFIALVEHKNLCSSFLKIIAKPLFQILSLVAIFFLFVIPAESPMLPIIVVSFLSPLIFLPSPQNHLFKKILTNKYMVFVGKISYSLYLYHFIVFAIFRWTLGLTTIWTQFLALALTFFFSIFSFYFFENKIRYSKLPQKILIPLLIFGNFLLFWGLNIVPKITHSFSSDSYSPLLFQGIDRPQTWSEEVQNCHYKYYKWNTQREVFQNCLNSPNQSAF